MKITKGNNFAMKSSQQNSRQVVAVGNSQITSLPFLVPQNKRSQVKIWAIGNGVSCPKSLAKTNHNDNSEKEVTINPIQAINYFVASSNGDIEEILSCVMKLKQVNPCLKIVIADSEEFPRFLGAPPGVDLVIPVTREQSLAATGLLANKAGFLSGPSGGKALCSSALIANHVQDHSTIMTAMTNLNHQLLAQLNI